MRSRSPSSVALSPLDRRAFLRAAALLGAGATLPGWLAGCGTVAALDAVGPLEVDPARPWWLQNGFGPVAGEIDAVDLEVRGALPPELDGLYVRNGSNPQNADSPHWFLGDGMLHGVRLRSGRALSYRNRYVRTPLYEQGLSGLGGGLPSGGNNLSNVSVIWHGGRLLSSGEVGAGYAIDPADLSTLGVHDFNGAVQTSFTAHSKIDPVTGHLHFFGYWFMPPYLTYLVADATGQVIHRTEIPVRTGTMMHSFAITERDVIFWELPVIFDTRGIAVHGFPFLWNDDYGARIGVMPLGGSAGDIRWAEIPPCYVFHELNAYRATSDEIVLDVCRYERMMDGERFGTFEPHLHRWHLDTGGAGLGFRDEVLEGERVLEFPVHDRRFAGRAHRHGFFAEPRRNSGTIDVGGLVHRDFLTGHSETWDPGLAVGAGEPLFVPASAAAGEGEGWLVTFVYDRARDESRLAVIDATRVARGPVAEVVMPRRVPHGFHGCWVPGEALAG